MFQSLTANQTLYILNKTGYPTIDVGIVQGMPRVRQEPSTKFGEMPKQVVDVTVLVNGQTVNYTLPAFAVSGTLQGNGSIAVAMTKEAISNEILAVKQESIDHINSNEFHQNRIAKCDELWQSLNPEAQERKAQEEKINSLEEKLNTMASSMAQLMEMNKKLLERESERASKTKNKEEK